MPPGDRASRPFVAHLKIVAWAHVGNPNDDTVPEVQASGAASVDGADYRFHESLVHDGWGASGDTLDILRRGYCAGERWAAGHFAAVLDEPSERARSARDADGPPTS